MEDLMEDDFPDTIVFWNWEDYPVPYAHLCSIRRNIEEALDLKGFRGDVDIWAYGDHLNQVELRKAQITYYEPETSWGLSSAVSRMPTDMIACAASFVPSNNLVVIAKQGPEKEWHRVLQCLQSRNHTVLVLEPPDDAAFHSVESLVRCFARVPQISEDPSKIQDFSKPITCVKGAKTVVFWDVVACPFPTCCSDPDDICHKIDETLGPCGETSIWAYLDESNNDGPWSGACLRNKTWDSRVYFLPGGASRSQRMLDDILLLLSLDSPQARSHTTRLLVVSDQCRDDTYFFDRLENFSDWYHDVFLVTPTRDINDPHCTEWEQLLGQAYYFEPPPVRHKGDAQVFWNLEDYPIPDGVRLTCFRRNIQKALKRMGFDGNTYFQAYGDRWNHGRAVLREAGVKYFLPEGGYYSAVSRMPLDMIKHAYHTGPSTFLLIAKQSPERGELHRVLQCLKSRNHTAFVVDDTAQSLKSVVKCIRVLEPVSKSPEDVSKIQNFSEPITHAKGDKTAVFWDVVDCPFPPLCSDPDEMYRRIEEALGGRGCIGHEISIWAYVDENNNDGPWSGACLRNKKTWDSRIYFLPGGASRPERMLNDMCLLEMDCLVDNDPAKMILVSDQVREGSGFFRTYQHLNGVCLVTPTRDVKEAESPEWPGLLLAETAILFGSQSQPSKEHAAEEVIHVFWNSDDYPFPHGSDFGYIVSAIDNSLLHMSFNGIPEIWAYGDLPNYHDIERLSKIYTLHFSKSSRGDGSADFRMPLDMLLCAATRGPSKFWVIAKQRPEGELQRVQQWLKSRDHSLLVVDDTCSLQSLSVCTQVFGGGDVAQVLRERKPRSKSLDTERIQTHVFWNLEDVPFPHCSDPDIDPDIIYRRMVSSLGARGFTGEMSIWAYVDEKKGSSYLRDKTWDSRIYFLPGGASRMLSDILSWHMDSPNEHYDPAVLILVADHLYDPFFFRMLDSLERRCYVFLVTATRHVAYLFGSESESESESSEPNPIPLHLH